MKYRVYGNVTLSVSVLVEANSENEAIELAPDVYGGISNYCGMGKSDALIGPDETDNEQAIYADGEIDFTEAELEDDDIWDMNEDLENIVI